MQSPMNVQLLAIKQFTEFVKAVHLPGFRPVYMANGRR
jgi:hypothetical protein